MKKLIFFLIALSFSSVFPAKKADNPDANLSFLADMYFTSDRYDTEGPLHYDLFFAPGIKLHYKEIYDFEAKTYVDTTRKIYLGDIYGHFMSGDIDEYYEGYGYYKRNVYFFNSPLLRLTNTDSLSRNFNNQGVKLHGFGFFGFDIDYLMNYNNEVRVDTTIIPRRNSHMFHLDSPEIRGISLGGYLYYNQELKELQRLSGFYLSLKPPRIARFTGQFAKGRTFESHGNAYAMEISEAKIRLQKTGSYNIRMLGYSYTPEYRNCLGDSLQNTMGMDYNSYFAMKDYLIDFPVYVHAERQIDYTEKAPIARWAVYNGFAYTGVRLGLLNGVMPEIYGFYEWLKVKDAGDPSDVRYEKYSGTSTVIACRFQNENLMVRPLLKFYKPSLEQLEGGMETDISLVKGLNLLARVNFQNDLEKRDYRYYYIETRYQLRNWALLRIGYGDENFGANRPMGEDISWYFLYDRPVQHKWFGEASFYF
ncbi:MAG: hypothetical protein JXA60_11025 [Candidatus Coatesbacteria bacterium]|nr:hypothetical protein [Candidatus Coatesbacteria bacterium]